MFSKKSIVSSLFMVLFLGFFVFKVAAEDDDDAAGEIVADLLIGAGIAVCEEFVMCKFFMLLIVGICLIMVLIGLCSGEITCADICNSRNARRGLTTGAGYGFVRSFRRR
jgi:hypothetical protein